MIKKAFFHLSVVTLGLSMVALSGCAEEPVKTQTAPPPPAIQPVKPPVNGITAAACNAGVKSCAYRLNQVTNYLTTGTQNTKALLFMPPNNPDKNIISTSLAIPVNTTSVSYASASVAPNQANDCGGMYETVTYWPEQCSAVESKNYQGLKKNNAFGLSMTVLDVSVSAKIFLMPAGKGCVSIKKEVVQ